MANITIQNESVEMESRNAQKYSNQIFASISFETPKTIGGEYVKHTDIALGFGNIGDYTFDKVEIEINEYLTENYPDTEIIEVTRLEIYEKRTFKKKTYDS